MAVIGATGQIPTDATLHTTLFAVSGLVRKISQNLLRGITLWSDTDVVFSIA